jgi:hypothetical protein
VVFAAFAMALQVVLAGTVTTSQVFAMQREPVVGKLWHHALSRLSLSSHPVPVFCEMEIWWQSSPGWISYVVPAQGVGVGSGMPSFLSR